MTDERGLSLERALAKTEADAEATLKAATAVATSLKRFRAAAQAGNLRDLRAAVAAAEQALGALRQQFANAKEGWDFDEDGYFTGGNYARELLETAKSMNVRLFEQDDRLYSYPVLVRVLANERAVLIDKTRERRLRPSVLVARLRDLQKRPARFRPEAFLASLAEAYDALDAAKSGKMDAGQGGVVRLLDVYSLLTLLPGQSKEYSRQEFARDVYLLDGSGLSQTRDGRAFSLPASTGTKQASGTIRVVTEDGSEKVYYGISFSPAE
ncbi:MAG: hypothetical protein HY329_13440 [Chloroflexi bacterium]|nr:hypothetical protein [Chloroflexota bacterium]